MSYWVIVREHKETKKRHVMYKCSPESYEQQKSWYAYKSEANAKNALRYMIKTDKAYGVDNSKYDFWVEQMTPYVKPKTYIISQADVDLIKTKYENAKYFHHNEEDDKIKWLEKGRADALEAVLRILGFDYSEIAKEK